MSHPAWVRGLKLGESEKLTCAIKVAPRVGAWIETTKEREIAKWNMSHPAWVRGLKLSCIKAKK